MLSTIARSAVLRPTPSQAGRLTTRAVPSVSRRAAVRVLAFREDDKNAPYKSSNSTESITAIPAFTRRRERQVGRIAMLGCVFGWAGEQLTGLGPLTQLSNETGMPMYTVYAVTALLAASQLFLGLSPASATFDEANQRDVNKRKKGLTGYTDIETDVTEKIDIANEPGKFFLRNELNLGRAAMLIFASACLMEFLWNGDSPLAHLGLINPGAPLSSAPLWLKAVSGVFLLGGFGVFSGFNSNKANDTY